MNKAPKTIQDVAAAHMQNAREDRIDAAVRSGLTGPQVRHMDLYANPPGKIWNAQTIETIAGYLAKIRQAYRDQS